MNYFAKLPLKFRLVVELSFLIASVVVGITGRPSPTLLLASILLLLAGGWRISKTRSSVFVLILMPALVGLLLTHFDWHHPFLSRYAAGLFSVIAVLLLMDGVRIEEWIEILRGKYGWFPLSGLAPLLIGTAVGTISMSSNIREQRVCRKLAKIHSWRAKSRTSIFLDSVALPFYNAVESHEVIDEALHRWSAHDAGPGPRAGSEMSMPPELTFANSNFIARLSDLHDFPGYRDVTIAALSRVPIAEAWTRMISQLAKPARILEIGDPTGQFAKYVLERGFEVISLADKYAPGTTLHHLSRPDSILKVLEAPLHECDHIFFHHTSFLEAVNQTGARDVLRRLHEILCAGAHICFDYPAKVMTTTRDVIFCGFIDGLGKVEYRYSQHEQDGDTHNARLEYTVRQAADVCCVRTPVSFVAPGLPDVLVAARDAGFSCSTCPMPGAVFFFAGETAFVELKKSARAQSG